MRYDPKGRKNFSSLTTFLVGFFLPVAVSSEPHKAQYPQNEKAGRHTTNQNRMCMSGKISLFTLPIILLFDLILLLVLVFNKGFRLDSRLILGVDDADSQETSVFYKDTNMAKAQASSGKNYINERRLQRKYLVILLSLITLSLCRAQTGNGDESAT